MGYKVGVKGEIVIAKEIRDRLGVKPGWVATQRLVDGHLEVHFEPPQEDYPSLAGSLAPYIKARIPPDKWHEAKEKAWAEHVRERFEGYGQSE